MSLDAPRSSILRFTAAVLALTIIFLSRSPGPAAQAADIVLYASDVTAIAGNWQRLSSTTGAGGRKMSSADRGWSTTAAPLAAPADYFEATFEAAAGVPYRVWLRLRATGDSKWNESVWVQFAGAVDADGSPLWPIGSTSALLVNLETCSACGVAGWGWQDNAWWLGTSSVVRFAAAGPRTIRVQTREDGVDVDQIVLSAGPYFNAPPGQVKNDQTIVPKAAPSVTLLRAPYLQQVTDSGAFVVWTTREPGPADVRYVAGSGPAVTVPAETRLFAAATTGLSYDFYQHEARLTGLAPATRYAYDIVVGGLDANASADAFTTAPVDGSGTTRFVAFGDSGVGSTAQRQLAGRIAADTFDLAIHAGDVAYGNSDGTGGGSYRQFDDWVFGVYGGWLRSRPFFPSIGNHDDEIAAARPYREVFVLPEHGASAVYPDHAERFYSFDYGPVHFVALDTELAFQDPARRQAQIAWLDADLRATLQPWRVVYLHRPPYSAGGHHGSDLAVRAALAPIFEQHGVQLVVAAHEHEYERSTPWREYRADGQAVTYLVTGGGGGPLYPAGIRPWTAASASAHHYVRATAGNCTLMLDAIGLDAVVFDRFELDRCAQAADTAPPATQIASPPPGSTVSGAIEVRVNASDDTRVVKVDLYIDGVLQAVDEVSPYVWTWDTRAVADGAHVLEARAHDLAGRRAASQPVSVSVANGTARDLVLYASDVGVIQGNWTRLTSTTGAGGLKMTSADRGWSSTNPPVAAPVDYFEASFDAPAGAYRLWLRLRGAAESKYNESVWVQFSDAVTASGAPLWRLGTTSALLVNLEDCSGCGISGWGWQDNAWWLGDSSVVRFTAGGAHTIRVQTREDGVDVDQIVLSPARYFSNAPGTVRGDQTIVPK